MGIWLDFHVLAIVSDAAINIGVYSTLPNEIFFSYSRSKCLKAISLDCMYDVFI